MGQFAWIVKSAPQNFHFQDLFWREQTLAATKLFLSLTRIDFAIAVFSRAVRISSRAVRVSPALSLRRVRPSYGTFSFMVFQGNCARGRTGHMIILFIIWLAPWAGKMNQTARCDCLPERARWSHLAINTQKRTWPISSHLDLTLCQCECFQQCYISCTLLPEIETLQEKKN